MKLSIAVLLVCFNSTALAADYIVALAPSYAFADRTNVLKAISQFVLEDAAPGDTIRIVNARDQVQVTTFKIPQGELFKRNRQARYNRMQREAADLRAFVVAAPKAEPQVLGTIDFPRFLDFIAQLSDGGKPIIVIIANPFYVAFGKTGLNMLNSYCSDGHLMADPGASVFSTKNRHSALAGMSFHYGYLRECFNNHLHREKTGRFWALYIGTQQGVLATFVPDVGVAFQRARQDIKTPCIQANLDLRDSAMEMRSVLETAPPVVTVQTNIARVAEPLASPQVIVQVITNTLPPIIERKYFTNVVEKERVVYMTNTVEVVKKGASDLEMADLVSSYRELQRQLIDLTSKPARKPVLNPWEAKGGEQLVRLSEESRKPK